MNRCSKCGFPLGARPGMYEENGVCGACINLEAAKSFDWAKREQDLKEICEKAKLNNAGSGYDCIVAVSGGKDSTVIVADLVEKYGMKPLLVTVTDEFEHTKAGIHNHENIARRFNLDHLTWRCEPQTFRKETLQSLKNDEPLLKWIEEKIYTVPAMIANKFGIDTVFFGENSDFQYGSVKELAYEHFSSTPEVRVYFYFAFKKYSEMGNRKKAKEYGFKDLEDFKEWYRQGQIERYTQQDSVGYITHLWFKFLAFGFQRVADIACRYVRDGLLTKEQAEQLIKDHDWRLDQQSKEDVCRVVGITEKEFNDICDKRARKDILEKDVNGNWRLK